MVARHYYMPTDAQRLELKVEGDRLRAKTAAARERARSVAASVRPVMNMLETLHTARPRPLAQPFVNSTFTDL